MSGALFGFVCYRNREGIRDMRGDFGDFMRCMRFAVPVVTTFIGLLCVAVNIMDVLKPILAPRLYLIEYFRYLAR